ncbi:MAG: hypothetical protein JW700_01150 [Candidatus Aenigmarchaeota archaeon]|nr:hypothetical protein [Candidatus Aenigmarchaeota archaeon]
MRKIIFMITSLILMAAIAEAALTLSVSWTLSADTIMPGSQTILTLTFTNAGTSEITNVFVEQIAGPSLSLLSDATQELGAIASASSQQTSIIVKANEDAKTINSFVLVNVEYYSGTTKYSKSISVPVQIKRYPILQIENVAYDKTPEAGQDIVLSFDIMNVGDGAAKYLKISLNQSSVFSVETSGGETVIQTLDSMGSQNVKFPIIIDPDASVGINNIPVILSYQDEARISNYSQTVNIGMTITGSADFVASFEPGDNFYYGTVGEAEITISNKGSGPAEFVTVKAISDHGSKDFYVGSLDVDDSETIDLSQNLAGVSEDYPIILEISYRDKFQNSYFETMVVQAVPNRAPADYTMLLVLLVLGAVVFWYYRKKKKK